MYRSKFANVIPMRYWTILAILALFGNIIFLTTFFRFNNFDNRQFEELNSIDDGHDDQFNSQLIDTNHFEYLLSTSECKFDDPNEEIPHFILAVNSNPMSKEMRQTIRDSWGTLDEYSSVLFFMGTIESGHLQNEIETEHREFGDIIQGNFLDCQHNLTYKHLMMLKWFSENCANAKYLVKIDEDVFPNVPAIFDYLLENHALSDLLMEDIIDPKLCPRNGTWGVTYEEYASDYYPTHVSRHSIIYSRDVVDKLLAESFLVKFFWVEEVFVTGILRSQLNIEITPLSKYILSDWSLADMRKRTLNLPDPPNFMFSLPELSIHDQLMLWERTEWYRLGEKDAGEKLFGIKKF